MKFGIMRPSSGLIVDAADAYLVDVAPILLVLGMLQGVAVDLAGGGEHEAGALGEGEAQGVVGSESPDLEDGDRDARKVPRARGGGEVVDLIELSGEVYVGGHVVVYVLEVRLVLQV